MEELRFLGLWENLITIFGNPLFFIIVLFAMFAYYAIRADINKWTLLLFFTIVSIWVGYTINFLFLFVALVGLSILAVEIIRKIAK